ITIGQQGRDLFVWVTGRWGDIPNVAIIGVVVALICAAIQRYTHFGRYSLAIGAGEQAALASGIPVDRFKVFAFALSGGLASLAGMLLAGRLSSGSPTLANELLLPAIAAVVVGGTAITGGSGGVLRTALGALIISVVRIGMTFLGVNIFAQQIVFGIVLILAVAITMDRIRVLVVK
ncbi:MAG: ABC transporter permease, partial [Verrucomicrobia bacterium]|nr:ABC transporter permease [Verrucomicrobiota bacterium]